MILVEIVEAEAETTPEGHLRFAVTCAAASGRFWGSIAVAPSNLASLEMFFGLMSDLGLNQSFFAGNPTNTDIADALLGRSARVSINSVAAAPASSRTDRLLLTRAT